MNALVVGEALVDFVPAECGQSKGFVPLPGGSPSNVAVGLARLDVATGFMGAISKDQFGSLLISHMRQSGVDLSLISKTDRPTALSFTRLSGKGVPQFSFYGTDAADSQLSLDCLPDPLPSSVRVIHYGSLAIMRRPIADALLVLIEREQGKRVISFDPNVRPATIRSKAQYKTKLLRWIALSDLVKVSETDLSYLYPNESLAVVANRWLELGPSLVVITRGAQRAIGFNDNCRSKVSVPTVEVVDTVGAGDAFSSGLLSQLLRNTETDRKSLANLDEIGLGRMMGFAARVAAITCSRMGADPPRLSQLQKFQ